MTVTPDAAPAQPPPPVSRPTISIVIDNYNYEAYLTRSIDSALDQTRPPIEVVVVDDVSTDGSPAIIRSYGDRIRSVLKTVNGGQFAAFQAGYALTTGDVVLFLDSDDFLHPDALARLAEVYDPSIALYQSRLDQVDARDDPIDIYPPWEVRLDQGDTRATLALRGRISTTVTSGLAFGRAALAKTMDQNAEVFRQGGDGYLAVVTPLYGSVKIVPGVLGAYRQHGANHAQFALAVGKKARWRLEHDEARYAALREHAERTGLKLSAQPGLNDYVHLEERIASLRLDPELHAYEDNRFRLTAHGLASLRHAPLPVRRRAALVGWWLMAGLAPRRIADRVISWKLSAGSRPAWVTRLAATARKVTGGGRGATPDRATAG